MKKLVFSIVFTISAHAQQKIEFISNFHVNTDHLTEIVKSANLIVVPSDLSDYKEALSKKKPTSLQKLFKKIFPQNSPSIELEKEISKFIFWNLTKSQHRLELEKLPKEKMILFMWEPSTVLPEMYSERLQKCFSRIYTWDDDLVDNITYFKFYYPRLSPMIEHFIPFKEKKLCTMVVGFHKSSFPEELYSERVKVIEFFEEKPEGDFEFFGRGWKNSYKTYRGTIENKFDVIKHYRFSICFENTKNIKGYITEKILDCFAAGNVPIYWGASNVEEYIPKGCFIDMRAFHSLEELYAFIKNMPEDVYEGYIEKIREFLQSEQAQLFSQETFKKIFYEAATAPSI